MKIITLHCDYIKFKPLKKAIKNAEELKNKDEQRVDEPLVVLTAIENGDNDKTLKQLENENEQIELLEFCKRSNIHIIFWSCKSNFNS